MGAESKIEWCDDTVNFWIGCTNVSPGCDHCYAQKDWGETGRRKRVTWGPHGSRSPTKNPVGQLKALNAKAIREGRRRRVFINSLSDWADNHPSITSGLRGNIFESAKMFTALDFLLLSKRPQNFARYLPDDWGTGYPNVWLGTTIENRQEGLRRAHALALVPAVVRFWSCEPLLEDLGDLTRLCLRDTAPDGRPAVSWVIVGGESGSKARPFHVEWAVSIMEQCAKAGVAYFGKQFGSCPKAHGYPLHLRDRKGGDWNEWPEVLRVRQFPTEPPTPDTAGKE